MRPASIVVLVVLTATSFAFAKSTTTVLPQSAGTITDFPVLDLRFVEGSDLQSACIQNQEEYRRSFVEFSVPTFAQNGVRRATLIITDSDGRTNFPPDPPDIHEVSSYAADLVVDVSDYDVATTLVGTFETDLKDAEVREIEFDVTHVVRKSSDGNIGFRIKLAIDPDGPCPGSAGGDLGGFFNYPPRLVIETKGGGLKPPGTPDSATTVLPEKAGTIQYLPIQGILGPAPVGPDLQSTCTLDIETREVDWRRAFIEFAIPVFTKKVKEATLIITPGNGYSSSPVAADVHEVSYYPADLVIDASDFNAVTEPLGTLETDENVVEEPFEFDVTDIVREFQGSNLGFRIKLMHDPGFCPLFLGSGFDGLATAYPPKLVIKEKKDPIDRNQELGGHHANRTRSGPRPPRRP